MPSILDTFNRRQPEPTTRLAMDLANRRGMPSAYPQPEQTPWADWAGGIADALTYHPKPEGWAATAGGQLMDDYNSMLSGVDPQGGRVPNIARLMYFGAPGSSGMGGKAGLGFLGAKTGGAGKLAATVLPMDEASRMGRATDYDFSGYHGTAADIDEFKGMTWASETPELANEYSFMRNQLNENNAYGLAADAAFSRLDKTINSDGHLVYRDADGSVIVTATKDPAKGPDAYRLKGEGINRTAINEGQADRVVSSVIGNKTAPRGLTGEFIMPVKMKTGHTFDADRLPKTVSVGSMLNEMIKQSKMAGRKLGEDEMEKAKGLLGNVRRAAKREESGPNYSRHNFWNNAQDMFGHDGKQAIDDLFDMFGFDSVTMKEWGGKTVGVFDPKNVRSRFAMFDPARKDAGNIMASGAGAATLASALMNSDEI